MSQDLEKQPIYSQQAEMCTLGSGVWGTAAMDTLADMLEPEDFWQPAHAEIFRAMVSLSNRSSGVDLVTLRTELESRGKLADVGGWDYLVQIGNSVPSPSHAKDYALIVRGHARDRRTELAGEQVMKLARAESLGPEEKLLEIDRLISAIDERKTDSGLMMLRRVAHELDDEMVDAMETGTAQTGIMSGLHDLDGKILGASPGQLIVVGGRPGMGKSAFVVQYAVSAANSGLGAVAIYSAEMRRKEVIRRIISQTQGISMNAMRSGGITESIYQTVKDGIELVYGLPIAVQDRPKPTVQQIRRECRKLKHEQGLAMIVVDHIHLMKGSSRTRDRLDEVGEIVRDLKDLAAELDAPVIAAAQLNRGVESRENKRPMLADLKESGEIEQSADIVLFPYRDAYYAEQRAKVKGEIWTPDPIEQAEIIIAKHRNGPTGTVLVGFEREYTRFRSLYKAAS